MRNESYVLRLWQTHPGEAWRVTLIPVERGAPTEHFATIADFSTFLKRNYPDPTQLYTIIGSTLNPGEKTPAILE